MKKYHLWQVVFFTAISLSFQGCADKNPTVSPVISSLACPDVKLSVTLIRGTTYMGTMKIPYKSLKPEADTPAVMIKSTGVEGLTATLQTNRGAAGGTLVYVISGSPDTTGNARFLLTIHQQSCVVSVPVWQ